MHDDDIVDFISNTTEKKSTVYSSNDLIRRFLFASLKKIFVHYQPSRDENISTLSHLLINNHEIL